MDFLLFYRGLPVTGFLGNLAAAVDFLSKP
jgi:hypothetical protein